MNETELERVIIRLLGDGSDYAKMIQDAARTTKDAADQIQKSAGQIEGFKKTIEGFASTTIGYLRQVGVGLSLWGSFKAFEATEVGMVRLKAAVEAAGKPVDSTVKEYVRFAKEIEAATTLSKGQVLAMLQMATSMGLESDQAEKAAKNAVALAAAKGGEAESYIRATVAMEKGNYHLVQRTLGLHGVQDKTQLVNQVNALLASGMKISGDLTQTTSGRIAVMQREMAKLGKEVGGVLAQVINPLVASLRSLVEGFNNLDPAVRSTLVIIMTLLLAIKPLLLVVGLLTSGWGKLVVALSWGKSSFLVLKNMIVELVVQFGALKIAMYAMAAVLTAVIIIQLIDIARKLWEVMTNTKGLTAALEESQKLTDKSVARIPKGTQSVIDEVYKQERAGVSPDARREFLRQAVKEAERDADSARAALERAQKNLKNTRTIFGHGAEPEEQLVKDANARLEAQRTRLQTLRGELKSITDKMKDEDEKVKQEVTKVQNALLEELEGFELTDNELEKYKKHVKEASDEQNAFIDTLMDLVSEQKELRGAQEAYVDELIKATQSQTDFKDGLEETIKTFGMSSDAAAIFKMRLTGVNSESLKAAVALAGAKQQLERYKSLLEEGQSTVDQFKDPQEKLADRIKQLNQMLEYGAIPWKTYKRAVAAAEEEMVKAGAAAAKLTAISYGSAEALEFVSQYVQGRIEIAQVSREAGVYQAPPPAQPPPLERMIKDEKADKMVDLLAAATAQLQKLVEKPDFRLAPSGLR